MKTVKKAGRIFAVPAVTALVLGMIMPVYADDPEDTGESVVIFNFDDGFQGWTAIDADGDGRNWETVTDFKTAHSYYASIDLTSWAYGETETVFSVHPISIGKARFIRTTGLSRLCVNWAAASRLKCAL